MTKCMLMAERLGSNGLTKVSDLAASNLKVGMFPVVDCEIVADFFLG